MAKRGKDGKYRIRLRVGGRRISHTFSKKEDADRKELELKQTQELIRAGMEAPKDSVLFLDYAAAWLRKREKRLPQATVQMDESRLRLYLLGRLGPLPLPAITSKMVRELLDEIQDTPWKFDAKYKDERGPLSNATRNRIRALLHTLFHDAFMDERVVLNPVARVPLLAEKKNTTPPLTQGEADRLMVAAQADGPRSALLVALMAFEGRRVSEAVAVKNADFNLERSELTISRIFEQETGEVKERIKGRDEGIVLPLFPRVRDAFLEHWTTTGFKSVAAYCIHDERGEPMSTYQARRLVGRLAREAGIRSLTPHVLRATFATLAEEAGFSKEDIQRMLGHSTVLVTQRYTRRDAQPLVEKGERLGFGLSDGQKKEDI